MSTEETVASRLRRLRLEKKLSVGEMAGHMGVSRPTIWKWEKGKSSPRDKKIPALAEALGISERELILGETELTEDRSNKTLEEEVVRSKERIAALAGVSVDKVRISIEI
jgi:transcriptional regulator with XRE-family HTH domain